jgi:osmoprotectant transport system permease protein
MTWAEINDWFSITPDIQERLIEHVQLSFVPVLAAILIAVPVGLYIGHARRFEFAAVTIANLGRSIPSFAILALFLPISIQLGLGLGFWPTFAALFLLSLPPILTNTYAGVKGVDADAVEAGRAMGMTGVQVLGRIEVPLGMSLIVGGVRTAAVQSVATATLAALVAGGGLGYYIRLGFRSGDHAALVGGALLVGALALVTELTLGIVERFLRPRSGGPRAPSKLEPWVSGPRPSDAIADI